MKKYIYISLFLIPMFVLSGCNLAQDQEGSDQKNQPAVEVQEENSELENTEMTYPEEAEVYKLDLEESEVVWRGKRVIGDRNHFGTVDLREGNIVADEENYYGGDFTIDMTTITDQDLSGGSKESLENHLKSEDFFEVETYPTASFITTKVETNPDQLDSTANYIITGDLTIKDTTREISFPAIVNRAKDQITASAEFTIDRTLWNVRYGSDKFYGDLGESVIDDFITYEISLVANEMEDVEFCDDGSICEVELDEDFEVVD